MLAQFCNFYTVVFAHTTLDLVEHGFYHRWGACFYACHRRRWGGSEVGVARSVGEVTPGEPPCGVVH